MGVKNFTPVVILDPRTKGHVWRDTAHVQPQNCHGPLCTAKRPTFDIVSISETTIPINMKFQDNIWTPKMCPVMQYCDVITNPRWRTVAILKIAKSPYLSEKSCDFEKNLVHYSRYWAPWQSRDQKLKFLKIKTAAAAILKIDFTAISHRPIVRLQRNFVRWSKTACRRGLHEKKLEIVYI